MSGYEDRRPQQSVGRKAAAYRPKDDRRRTLPGTDDEFLQEKSPSVQGGWAPEPSVGGTGRRHILVPTVWFTLHHGQYFPSVGRPLGRTRPLRGETSVNRRGIALRFVSGMANPTQSLVMGEPLKQGAEPVRVLGEGKEGRSVGRITERRSQLAGNRLEELLACCWDVGGIQPRLQLVVTLAWHIRRS
ncbi:uncharacterized protein BO80DRAFT_84589 [Aspergillus ibericus CBS 121593]|uniref:Uncharacterized protein n=1 Tax=Aspergillus ibericus CBS 121593 TaxID=1448316 RepID=A0A395HE73_9EURO|nr:hypothetical protein BO80DRAFT_84589 [Aspergillus ibericus CBS 121593]RAL05966.1 hypothetical protein BO80DRAFT_84589 [Aspergillus ibericus CBS 121593]